MPVSVHQWVVGIWLGQIVGGADGTVVRIVVISIKKLVIKLRFCKGSECIIKCQINNLETCLKYQYLTNLTIGLSKRGTLVSTPLQWQFADPSSSQAVLLQASAISQSEKTKPTKDVKISRINIDLFFSMSKNTTNASAYTTSKVYTLPYLQSKRQCLCV